MWGSAAAETDLQNTFDLPVPRRRESDDANPIARTRLRMLCWLLLWLALSTVNLVSSIIIPYMPSTVLSVGCLLAASFVAKGAFLHSTDVLMQAIKGLVPICLIILINYIALAESVDVDHFRFANEDELERYVESHPVDRFAVHVAMVTDLLLIACAVFVAESCFELTRALYGETRSSRPQILELFGRQSSAGGYEGESPKGGLAQIMLPGTCATPRQGPGAMY